MCNYTCIANNIVVDGKLFNSYPTVEQAVAELLPSFVMEPAVRQAYIISMITNILSGKVVELSSLAEVDNSLNTMYNTTIQEEQLSDRLFDYYECKIDWVTKEADIIDDFNELIATINVTDILNDKHRTISIEEAVRLKLVNDGVILPYDVISKIDEVNIVQ